MKITIEEGNKLIAEFMGAKLNCESGLEVNFHMNEFGYKIGNGDETFNSLKFHKSWDWLIPVVEKIENTELSNIKNNTALVNICLVGCSIKFNNKERLPILTNADNKLKAVYKAVVAFINWYNEQTNKNDTGRS